MGWASQQRGSVPYSVVGDFGNHVAPSGSFGLGSNFKSIIPVVVPNGGAGGVWVKNFHILMSISTIGDKLKPVLYNGIVAGSALVRTGQEFVVPSSYSGVDTDTTINWNADGTAVFIPAGNYGLGLITLAGTCRASAGTTTWNADAYADGASDPFGAVSSSPVQIIAWCPYSNTGP
jgi:hypothetical protein